MKPVDVNINGVASNIAYPFINYQTQFLGKKYSDLAGQVIGVQVPFSINNVSNGSTINNIDLQLNFKDENDVDFASAILYFNSSGVGYTIRNRVKLNGTGGAIKDSTDVLTYGNVYWWIVYLIRSSSSSTSWQLHSYILNSASNFDTRINTYDVSVSGGSTPTDAYLRLIITHYIQAVTDNQIAFRSKLYDTYTWFSDFTKRWLVPYNLAYVNFSMNLPEYSTVLYNIKYNATILNDVSESALVYNDSKEQDTLPKIPVIVSDSVASSDWDSLVNNIIKGGSNTIQTVFNKVTDVPSTLGDLATNLTSVVTAVATNIPSTLSNLGDDIVSVSTAVVTDIPNTLTSLGDSITDIASDLADVVTAVVTSLPNTLSDMATNIGDMILSIASVVTAVVTDIPNTLGDIFLAITDTATDVATIVTSVVTDIPSALVDISDGIVRFIDLIFNLVGFDDFLNSIQPTIASLMEGNYVDVGLWVLRWSVSPIIGMIYGDTGIHNLLWQTYVDNSDVVYTVDIGILLNLVIDQLGFDKVQTIYEPFTGTKLIDISNLPEQSMTWNLRLPKFVNNVVVHGTRSSPEDDYDAVVLGVNVKLDKNSNGEVTVADLLMGVVTYILVIVGMYYFGINSNGRGKMIKVFKKVGRAVPTLAMLEYKNLTKTDVSELIDNAVTEITDASTINNEGLTKLLNYMVGYTAKTVLYLLDPVKNLKPPVLNAEDLYNGVYNP